MQVYAAKRRYRRNRFSYHIHIWYTLQYQPFWCSDRNIPCALQLRHNGDDGVPNHQPHDCLLRLFGCRSKKTSKLRVTGLCERNSPAIGEFPEQRACNAENVSIWWRHHGIRTVPWPFCFSSDPLVAWSQPAMLWFSWIYFPWGWIWISCAIRMSLNDMNTMWMCAKIVIT